MDYKNGVLNEFYYGKRHPLVKSGFWFILIGFICLVVSLTIWWPANNQINIAKMEIASKQKQLIYMRQSEEMIRQFHNVEKILPELEAKLESPATQSQLVDALNKSARESKVHIISENYEDETADVGGTIITADLLVQGGYRSLVQFLQRIPSMPVWVDIREVHMESGYDKELIKCRIHMAISHS